MIGREKQTKIMQSLLKLQKSYFVAVTGRRRVGKTYLIDQVYQDHMCLRITGIQDADQQSQIINFVQKLAEYSNTPIVTIPNNWQEVFLLLKGYLKTLDKRKKHVLFIDELPWIATARSGFIQQLAHIWNDYLSKEKHFVLVICGSATSWITKKIINDRGGFHNRLSHNIEVKPFTLAEVKSFFKSRQINLTDNSIVEIYMALGGIPYYLENIEKGETPNIAIDRMCFDDNGILKNEYNNLYKALFDHPENHEAIVKALATSKSGLTRGQVLKKSKVEAGGPYTRAMKELIVSGFIVEESPFGKKKRGALYRLVDEYSVFYHKFIQPNKKSTSGIWSILSASPQYAIWSGYAFETLCHKHIAEIKNALGIAKVYTETSSYNHVESKKGFQIDLIIDRRDQAINLCECKFYKNPFAMTKKYADELNKRKGLFQQTSKTKKNVFTTMITNHEMDKNAYYLDAVDTFISVSQLMK